MKGGNASFFLGGEADFQGLLGWFWVKEWLFVKIWRQFSWFLGMMDTLGSCFMMQNSKARTGDLPMGTCFHHGFFQRGLSEHQKIVGELNYLAPNHPFLMVFPMIFPYIFHFIHFGCEYPRDFPRSGEAAGATDRWREGRDVSWQLLSQPSDGI